MANPKGALCREKEVSPIFITTPTGRKSNQKTEERKNAGNSGHNVLPAKPKAVCKIILASVRMTEWSGCENYIAI